jgi:hypothetical protein
MAPKSGNRFSEKVMVKIKNRDLDPFQWKWIKVENEDVLIPGRDVLREDDRIEL